jgi:hypothetical protein
MPSVVLLARQHLRWPVLPIWNCKSVRPRSGETLIPPGLTVCPRCQTHATDTAWDCAACGWEFGGSLHGSERTKACRPCQLDHHSGCEWGDCEEVCHPFTPEAVKE